MMTRMMTMMMMMTIETNQMLMTTMEIETNLIILMTKMTMKINLFKTKGTLNRVPFFIRSKFFLPS
jgi:hypothetical protein